MLGFALALQIIAVTGVTQGVDTSTYKTPALRALVLEAARINHRVPATLGRYHAQLESEISIGKTNGVGAEKKKRVSKRVSNFLNAMAVLHVIQWMQVIRQSQGHRGLNCMGKPLMFTLTQRRQR